MILLEIIPLWNGAIINYYAHWWAYQISVFILNLKKIHEYYSIFLHNIIVRIYLIAPATAPSKLLLYFKLFTLCTCTHHSLFSLSLVWNNNSFPNSFFIVFFVLRKKWNFSEVYADHPQKPTKRPSLFFRKKKDKSKSKGQSTQCDGK